MLSVFTACIFSALTYTICEDVAFLKWGANPYWTWVANFIIVLALIKELMITNIRLLLLSNDYLIVQYRQRIFMHPPTNFSSHSSVCISQRAHCFFSYLSHLLHRLALENGFKYGLRIQTPLRFLNSLTIGNPNVSVPWACISLANYQGINFTAALRCVIGLPSVGACQDLLFIGPTLWSVQCTTYNL